MTFDLQATRALNADLSREVDPHDVADPDFREKTLKNIIIAAKTLPDALDEIERLQSRDVKLDEITKIISDKIKTYVIKSSNRVQFALDEALRFMNEYEEQAKRIAELESNLIAQKSYVDYWESESDRQHAALKKLGKRSGQRGKALAEALESLEHIECQFFACPGPDEPFEDMATCHRCATIQMIRSQLRQEGLL